jgi:hypothetical protein
MCRRSEVCAGGVFFRKIVQEEIDEQLSSSRTRKTKGRTEK